jgi:hypothetical protein
MAGNSLARQMIGLSLVGLISACSAERIAENPASSIERFRYQPEKIEPGTVYQYTKSNLDGSNPARISIYVATRTHLEVLKVEQNSEVLAFVTADIDWESFSADHLSSWHILPDGLLRSQGATGLNREDDSFTKFIMGAEFPARVGYYPFHVYNFDFTSFNFVFRHLVDPEQSFEIGVVDPDWKRILSPEFKLVGVQRGIFVFRGRAQIDYVGDEPCNGAECRKYRINGPGMADQEGFIWVDRDAGHFVRFEHPLPDNPAWNSFKLELEGIEHFTEPEWQKFITVERERNLPVSGG